MTPQPIPYPADTKAKGWRFELDLEQVMQSDTWDIASEVPYAQPALLMIWAMAWMQTPCGSMPSDTDLIRVKCKIPREVWPQVRDVVLRGWWLAEDGRLYHDTIASRVKDMLSRKSDERQRKADYRARMEAERQAQSSSGVPQMSHGTDNGQQQDGHGKDDTGTGTGTGTGFSSSLRSEEVKPARAPRKPPADAPSLTLTVSDLISEGVKENHAREWFEVRKKHKAPLTQTAWNQHKAECLKAGITPGQGVQVCAAAPWRGFDHSWNWRKFLPAAEVATTPAPSKFGGCDAVEPA